MGKKLHKLCNDFEKQLWIWDPIGYKEISERKIVSLVPVLVSIYHGHIRLLLNLPNLSLCNEDTNVIIALIFVIIFNNTFIVDTNPAYFSNYLKAYENWKWRAGQVMLQL